MTRYHSSNNGRHASRRRQEPRTHASAESYRTREPRDDRSRLRPRLAEERIRTSDRTYSRTSQRERSRTRKRSIGADVLSFPASRALGLGGAADRPHGRGETARRVGDYGRDEYGQQEVTARPAVYTQESRKRGLDVALPNVVGRLPLVLAVLVVIAAIVVGVLWGPARAYYLAWRESGVLKVEYEALAQQNEALDHDLDRLQSLEGIEDEARRRGYVYPGEEALVVDGVEEQRASDPDQVQEAVDAYEASQPWYVGLLDSMFGYQRDK